MPGNLPVSVSGPHVRKLMRVHRVRIADVAAAYSLSETRVQHVREHGGPWDWPLMIEKISNRTTAKEAA